MIKDDDHGHDHDDDDDDDDDDVKWTNVTGTMPPLPEKNNVSRNCQKTLCLKARVLDFFLVVSAPVCAYPLQPSLAKPLWKQGMVQLTTRDPFQNKKKHSETSKTSDRQTISEAFQISVPS